MSKGSIKYFRIIVTSAILAAFLGACADFDANTLRGALSGLPQQEKEPFTNAESIQALRDALSEGVTSACGTLAKENGFYGNVLVKILLPPEAKPVTDSVTLIPGGQKLIDDVILRLNRSAEKAAKDAVPIFLKAIQDMSIADGIAIVRGGDTAATEYLQRKTNAELSALIQPLMQEAISTPLVAGISADKAWTTLVSAYNKAALVPNAGARIIGKPEPMPPVTVDLAGYATDKALAAVFTGIASEEKKIRAQPLEYVSTFIKKVFGALQQGK
ncbi:MAG: DUF4197 domain-containing protein [Spirochaetaceae bacterium]|nr:DUF4197 domain-containing protein [Spirochaetaceae bacterium]